MKKEININLLDALTGEAGLDNPVTLAIRDINNNNRRSDYGRDDTADNIYIDTDEDDLAANIITRIVNGVGNTAHSDIRTRPMGR